MTSERDRPDRDRPDREEAERVPAHTRHEVTVLLQRVSSGETSADAQLLTLIYDELKRLARSRLAREHRGRSLVATELVHECYLRLFEGDPDAEWENRAHFFGAAAEAMRRILVDRARSAKRLKRGGGRRQVELDSEDVDEVTPIGDDAAGPGEDELLALDTAIDELEERDPRLAKVVKLRYFAGLTVSDTARALDLTERTVHRDWAAAKAWLHRRLARTIGLEPDASSDGA